MTLAGFLAIWFLGFSLAVAHRALNVYLNIGWFKSGELGDASVHKLIVRHLRSGGGAKNLPFFVIPNRLSYPLLFHRLATFFPPSILTRFPFLPNSLILGMGVGLYAVMSWHFLLSVAASDAVEILLLSLFFFFIAANQNLYFGPAIVYLGFSARLLGRITTGLLALSLVFGLESPGDWNQWFTIAVVFAALSFLSSRFAIQTMFFVLPLQSFLLSDFRPTIVMLVGFLLATIVSKGYALTTVATLVGWWRVSFRRVSKSIFARRGAPTFASLPRLIQAGKESGLRGVATEILRREPLQTLTNLPLFFVLLAFTLWDNGADPVGAMMLSTAVVWMITSIKALNFLGESYRYIEFAMYFTVPFFLSREISQNFSAQTWIFASAFGLLSLAQIAATYWRKKLSNSEIDTLASFLLKLSLPKGCTVFPIPMRLGPELCLRQPHIRSFWWQPGGLNSLSLYDEYIEQYPYLKLDWRPLAQKHNATVIIADKRLLLHSGVHYDLADQELMLDSERWVAYRVKP